MSNIEVGSTRFNYVIIRETFLYIMLYWLSAGVGIFIVLSLIDNAPLGEHILGAFFPSLVLAGIFAPRIFIKNIKADSAANEAAIAAAKEEKKASRSQGISLDSTAGKAINKEAIFKGIEIGESIGKLHDERKHHSGIPEGDIVLLSPEDCAKNMIAFGGIGSGKTTRFVNPVLLQIMKQDAGALIFDIKTDFQREVAAITKHAGREYKVVGDGGMTLNLLRGTTPELAASFLKSCFLSQGVGDSALWADLATEHCRNALTLIKLTGGDYSIANLYTIAVDDDEIKELTSQLKENYDNLEHRDKRLAAATTSYFINWVDQEQKRKDDILLNVRSVLSPFAHPDLVDAFSEADNKGEADMTELINEGSVLLVNLPQTKYGKEGAKYAYMLIKLRFFNMMRERRTRSDWNQTRPVAFVCDEYQSIIDSISDNDFWDKSRSTKTIGVVAMQGVASLVQALNGNQKAAEAILQNFRQRVFFRTEDEATLRHIQQLFGQVDVMVQSSSEGYNESESVSEPAGAHGGPATTSTSSSTSSNVSSSITRQDLFGPNDMRSLTADLCLFIGNVGDSAADDVLAVQPLYVN